MVAHTVKNYPRLQTPCVNCSHPEWDHYVYHRCSRTACDSGGCSCYEFQRPPTCLINDEGQA